VAAYDGQSPCCCAIRGTPTHSNTTTDRNVNDESFTDCLPSKDIADAHEASAAAQNPEVKALVEKSRPRAFESSHVHTRVVVRFRTLRRGHRRTRLGGTWQR
jgi:hypothetical protein